MEIHSLQELDQALQNGMVLAIDDGTVTSKVDVTTIEKHAIESYAGSTLAGAAQSVQAALNGLMRSAYSLDGGTIVESGFNWDTCLTVGNYYLPTTGLADASVGTKPIAHPIGFLKVMKIRETANYTSQLFYVYDDLAAPYARNYTANNQTWSEWVKLPTREEMTNSIHMGTSGSTWASAARLSADTDINQILVGEWFWSDATNRPSVNCPDNNAVRGRLWALDSGGGDYYCCQVCYTSSFKWFVRYCTSQSAKTWTEWVQVPTRAEVDALSSNMAGITFTRMIATTSGTTATLPNNYRGILKTIDSSADRCGLYFVRTASNGSVNCTPVREATALTIDSSTANKLIVTSPGSSVCIFENISGTVTV